MKSKNFRKVLIAEDELGLLEELRILFESEFETVVLASDGAEAYVHSVTQDFDLIFSDIQMPGMNGIDFVARLRSEGKNAPVILTSTDPDREHLIRALRLGINDFIPKPYSPDTLKESLYRNLEMIRRQKKLFVSQVRHGIDSAPAHHEGRMLGLLRAAHSTLKKVIG